MTAKVFRARKFKRSDGKVSHIGYLFSGGAVEQPFLKRRLLKKFSKNKLRPWEHFFKQKNKYKVLIGG
jgi:hypothetical protein